MTLQARDLTLDLISRRVTRAGHDLRLTPRETDVLAYFIWNRNRPITTAELRERVWSLRFDPETNSVAVFVHRLRAIADKGFDQPLIHTIRRGPARGSYFFTDNPETLIAWGIA